MIKQILFDARKQFIIKGNGNNNELFKSLICLINDVFCHFSFLSKTKKSDLESWKNRRKKKYIK